jgi:hypothetical protein
VEKMTGCSNKPGHLICKERHSMVVPRFLAKRLKQSVFGPCKNPELLLLAIHD